ncbi:hypothetical protein PMAYCL1PPCAC_22435, partial [Pristionchus mayeri]
ISQVVFELGSTLYADYDGSWEERTFGNSILDQQICAIEACNELQRSLGFLTHIQQLKRSHHLARIRKRKLAVRASISYLAFVAIRPANAQELPHANANAFVLREDSTQSLPLFSSNTPIKEEQMDIKDEPIEVELKQEQPIADVFCPSTGNSRPIDS